MSSPDMLDRPTAFHFPRGDLRHTLQFFCFQSCTTVYPWPRDFGKTLRGIPGKQIFPASSSHLDSFTFRINFERFLHSSDVEQQRIWL